MLGDFLVRAGLAAVGVAVPAGVLGVYVVWRRMAYFGDATAHVAILGVALAIALSVSITAGVLGIALLMALAIFVLSDRGHSVDAVLGVLSHGALAVGLVAAALTPGALNNLDAYLFGDVLTVGVADLALIWGGGAVVAGLVVWRWNELLTATVSPDLAFSVGMSPRRAQLTLTLLLAVVVAVAIKVVGALLITALLIVPAASARAFARTPEAMAFAAAAIGAASALLGLWLSIRVDTPVGPTIVCVAVAIFAVSALRPTRG